ncbi:type II toxin-antitoxin system RelE/ParE family toxin [Aminobacter carboxidus]|uniref:type II toxin-antitoxin system RelE/ParE family toxin n=1 Tax=Aminobacter carboxidus TaxID=376165 RepID=UPI0031B605DE
MKTVFWIGSSRETVRDFPKEVRQEVGFALETAQLGGKAINVVPLVGFSGAGVLEVIANGEGGTYRTVYTVRFQEAVYILHAFQKKSKKGIATPRQEIALVRQRLKVAEKHHERELKKKEAEMKNVRHPG